MVEAVVVIVSVEDAAALEVMLTGFGEKDAVAPLGTFALSVTDPVNPPDGMIVTV